MRERERVGGGEKGEDKKRLKYKEGEVKAAFEFQKM